MLSSTKASEKVKRYMRQKLVSSIGYMPSLPIAETLSEINPLTSGYGYAIAETVYDCDPGDFEAQCGNGGKDAKKLVSKWIWEFVNLNPTNICLIDEQRRMAHDQSWRRDMLPSFANMIRFSNSSIFYCVSSDTANKEKVSELVESTFWYPFYCAFAVDDERIVSDPLSRRETTREKLLKMAMNTSRIVTDAYDLEGLLLWTKQELIHLDNL